MFRSFNNIFRIESSLLCRGISTIEVLDEIHSVYKTTLLL